MTIEELRFLDFARLLSRDLLPNRRVSLKRMEELLRVAQAGELAAPARPASGKQAADAGAADQSQRTLF